MLPNAMPRALVMTVIGRDRPGLVESVASVVADHGGNWLESRMSRLGGQFAGILRVEVAEASIAALILALDGLASEGLAVVVHPDQPEPAPAAGKLRALEIVGHDRPGIVREISRALASRGVNVEELETEYASAAMSGEALFKAQAKINIPDACDIAALRLQLEKIAEDLIVDITLEPITAG
jgi:glycine cleavage system regulatory protein